MMRPAATTDDGGVQYIGSPVGAQASCNRVLGHSDLHLIEDCRAIGAAKPRISSLTITQTQQSKDLVPQTKVALADHTVRKRFRKSVGYRRPRLPSDRNGGIIALEFDEWLLHRGITQKKQPHEKCHSRRRLQSMAAFRGKSIVQMAQTSNKYLKDG